MNCTDYSLEYRVELVPLHDKEGVGHVVFFSLGLV